MTEPTARPGRWTGMPAQQRRDERRTLLLDAAFDLFGADGETGASVRAICRVADLNARYFYESFVDRDELLGALYDRTAHELAVLVGRALRTAGGGPEVRARLGIEIVLRYLTEDQRRARILLTEARSNPVLVRRRRATLGLLMDGLLAEGEQVLGTTDRQASAVAAAMFSGAMGELAESWLEGRLGDDLERVVDVAVARTLSLLGLPPAVAQG